MLYLLFDPLHITQEELEYLQKNVKPQASQSLFEDPPQKKAWSRKAKTVYYVKADVYKELMKKRGIDSAIVAKGCGICKRTIPKAINQSKPIWRTTGEKLAKFFGVPFSYLIDSKSRDAEQK